VLCKTTTTPCEGVYQAGTVAEAVARPGTSAKITYASTTTSCKGSTLALKTTNSGSSVETVLATFSSLTFSECTCSTGATPIVKVLETGSVEIHYLSGTDNGTLTSRGLKLTVNCSSAGSTCVFSTPEWLDAGELKGGPEPVLAVNLSLVWTEGDGSFGLCGEKIIWEGEYLASKPSPLYVRAS